MPECVCTSLSHYALGGRVWLLWPASAMTWVCVRYVKHFADSKDIGTFVEVSPLTASATVNSVCVCVCVCVRVPPEKALNFFLSRGQRDTSLDRR